MHSPLRQVASSMDVFLALEGCALFVAATAFVAHLMTKVCRGPREGGC
jgi:hypothetical protein